FSLRNHLNSPGSIQLLLTNSAPSLINLEPSLPIANLPTGTGAAEAVALVIPEVKGKLNGIALRVPTPNVSIVDLVVQVEKPTITEQVNEALKQASQGSLKGILGYTELPLVSIDYRKTDESSTVDSSLTMVMGDDMMKVVAWYDNEWGYSQRVVDLAELVAQKWAA
ncbi:MAG: hypothetical protein AAFY67_24275, partial [Cyanobacteria bacterium J06642_9]